MPHSHCEWLASYVDGPACEMADSMQEDGWLIRYTAKAILPFAAAEAEPPLFQESFEVLTRSVCPLLRFLNTTFST